MVLTVNDSNCFCRCARGVRPAPAGSTWQVEPSSALTAVSPIKSSVQGQEALSCLLYKDKFQNGTMPFQGRFDMVGFKGRRLCFPSSPGTPQCHASRPQAVYGWIEQKVIPGFRMCLYGRTLQGRTTGIGVGVGVSVESMTPARPHCSSGTTHLSSAAL